MKKNLYYSVALVASLFVNTAFAQLFVANLSPANEAPDPFDTPMAGLAVASVTVNDDGSSDATIIVSAFGNTTPITQSHVHLAPAGVAGGVICPLTGPEFTNPVIASCHFDPDQTTALFNGNLYVNVHTMDHPGGEIRDQLTCISCM
jgi:hypothetical protein